jgi:hypothetical protein
VAVAAVQAGRQQQRRRADSRQAGRPQQPAARAAVHVRVAQAATGPGPAQRTHHHTTLRSERATPGPEATSSGGTAPSCRSVPPSPLSLSHGGAAAAAIHRRCATASAEATSAAAAAAAALGDTCRITGSSGGAYGYCYSPHAARTCPSTGAARQLACADGQHRCSGCRCAGCRAQPAMCAGAGGRLSSSAALQREPAPGCRGDGGGDHSGYICQLGSAGRQLWPACRRRVHRGGALPHGAGTKGGRAAVCRAH